MAAHQAPPSLGFSRQEHWSGLPLPSPMHESEKWKWWELNCHLQQEGPLFQEGQLFKSKWTSVLLLFIGQALRPLPCSVKSEQSPFCYLFMSWAQRSLGELDKGIRPIRPSLHKNAHKHKFHGWGPTEALLCPHPGLRNLDLRAEPSQYTKCEEFVSLSYLW